MLGAVQIPELHEGRSRYWPWHEWSGVSAAIGIDMVAGDDLAEFVSTRALTSAKEAGKAPSGKDL